MNVEDIMPREISQSQKDKYSMISFIWESESSQTYRGRESTGDCQALRGGGNQEKLLNGYKVSNTKDK